MKFQLIVNKDAEETVVATVHQPSSLTEQIEALVRSHTSADRIAGYTEDDMRILKFQDIACVTVLDGKTFAIDRQGKQYRLKQRLYELEAVLPHYFIRINKSSFANETQIREFSAAFSGAVDAIFHCGYREYVSRRCFSQIKRRYKP